MKEKEYLKDNKELMIEWNYAKNENIDLKSLTLGMNKKVWWKCEYGHEWEASIAHRSKGRNCPYCSNRKLLVGYNDLATKYPNLAKEWNYEKNINLKPTNIVYGSTKKVWWICEYGHEWEAKIYHRTNNIGCPYCSNRKLLVGYNDLATKYPGLAKEWNYKKNGNLKPKDVIYGSPKKVWWICEKQHEWLSSIDSRLRKGTNCPICSKELQTSFPEQTIFYYIKMFFPDAINGYKNKEKNITEIDIYIPSKNLGIEYDGSHWHKDRISDVEKEKTLAIYKINLFRIKESKDKTIKIKGNSIYYAPNNDKRLEELCFFILKKILDKDVERQYFNLSEHRSIILDNYINQSKKDSLLSLYPKIAKEWHPTKNQNLQPDMFKPKSDKRVWWKGSCGHEWDDMIKCRVRGNQCPICANKRILPGYNDLETKNPEIAKEWNYKKNEKLPKDYAPFSHKLVWWKCSNCGFEWKTKISNRSRGSKCPMCKNVK